MGQLRIPTSIWLLDGETGERRASKITTLRVRDKSLTDSMGYYPKQNRGPRIT